MKKIIFLLFLSSTGIHRGNAQPARENAIEHTFACTDYSQGMVSIISGGGKLLWHYPAEHCNDLWALPNGNLLFNTGRGVKEVTRDKKIVFAYESKSEIYACQRLANGNTFIGECNTGFLLEVAPNGRIVTKIKLLPDGVDGGSAYMRNARKLDNGNYLVAHYGLDKVCEYDSAGRLVRDIPIKGGPHSVIRLPNGNTVIACSDHNGEPRIVEIDASNAVIWQLTKDELPGIELKFMTGMEILPNGNRVFTNWIGHNPDSTTPHAFEVTRDKKVVWVYKDRSILKTMSSIQVLDASKEGVKTPETDPTIVERHGALRAVGTHIVDEKGSPVVLRGMSLYWSQWKGQFYNHNCVQWLRDDWKCSVVRAAMAVESGGYLSNPEKERSKIKAVIDACIDLGIYVIVDWHDHHGQRHTAQSIAFFEDIARQYHDKPNIIYEIYNEPLRVSWADSVKPYADSVVRHIRAIDRNNLIVVGNPTWSQDVDAAAADPVPGANIAYSLHFYAGSHKQALRDKATAAMNKGAALFVTEFGMTDASGNGNVDSTETGVWLKFLEDNKISWCTWSVADLLETSAALQPGASGTGGWPLSNISVSGLWVRNKIRAENGR